MATQFFIPAINIIGENAIHEALEYMKNYGFKHALIVTDAGLNKLGIIATIAKKIENIGIKVTVFDGAQPNPTVDNVNNGLAVLKAHACDFVISIGGGSPHDCAKAIALVATNGGEIADYEGLDKSTKPQLPLIAINTTAGTASEMTRFCIITDSVRHIKMAIVDKHTTPILSVNDPDLMKNQPKTLTAATGMDALTHAVEAYVSTGATPITDACAIQAIKLIAANLKAAVFEGQNMHAREQMAYAQFLAGMAFNNASLGYVHAMAHQLGGFYDLPHGVCNAVLLPHVQEFNISTSAKRLKDVAEALGCNVSALNDHEGAHAAIAAISALGKEIGIPEGLALLGVKSKDIEVLASNALKDACGVTNPRQASHAEICAIFESAM